MKHKTITKLVEMPVSLQILNSRLDWYCKLRLADLEEFIDGDFHPEPELTNSEAKKPREDVHKISSVDFWFPVLQNL